MVEWAGCIIILKKTNSQLINHIRNNYYNFHNSFFFFYFSEGIDTKGHFVNRLLQFNKRFWTDS